MINPHQTLFDDAQRIVFLTGAGVSTASGIPDFRSASGLYNQNVRAEEYLSHHFWVQHPDVFYDYCQENLYFPEAQPNVIHVKQAAFTQQNRATIVTQNIDNLYEAADAHHLINFHGNLYDLYCTKCQQAISYAEYQTMRLHQVDGGEIRPRIVLYDEPIPSQAAQAAVQAVTQADLVVIVGTSMRVYPFAGLLDYVSQETPVIVVNQEPLTLSCATLDYIGDATTYFASLQV